MDNLIVEIKSNQQRLPTLGKDKQETQNDLPEIGMSLDDLVRRGARQVIQQAIEAELAALLEQYANVTTLAGKQAVVRNRYLPERDMLTGAGPVTIRVPKVRDRAAVREEVTARVGRATMAIPEGYFDERHVRSAASSTSWAMC